TVQSERVISDKIVQRMQLASNILANALIRKQSEIKLQKAFNEIKTLKDQLEAEQTYLREEIKLEYNFDNIIGNSDALKYVLAKVEQVAPTDTTVLVLGETGTGKDLIARSIHEASGRKNKPLIKVDCTSLPANLIESELFGHEKGAFTGAHARKIGKFELANSGTIFLDEIGEMPLELQSKLLRVLQEGNFERIGGTKLITIDVRIIAATNRPLEEEAEKGRFRQDLWYRLNVFPITAPPLRERLEDVPVLVNWFVNKFSKKLGRKLEKIPDAVLEVLQNSSWPGNIRELENVIERAVINSPGSILQLADWNVVNPKITKQLSVRKSLSDVQRQHIRQVLQDVNWKIEGQKGAAAILDLKPSTLRDRMNKLGIKRP
ncbi:MAG: sigma 54-interacting transcriptional regulator, partial [Deltaproteobacteria bacterium]|nr:sigma 54-interacting transcriptional regulator [Deltaproteobacteria bacterium]